MKNLRLTQRLYMWVVIAGGAFSSLVSSAMAECDHLQPASPFIARDYETSLRNRLFVTSAEYGRLVNLKASLHGEVCIAIHDDAKSPSGVSITLTEAEKNIGNSTIEGDPNRVDAGTIGIRRRDASFPRREAEAVRTVLKRAIPEARSAVGEAQQAIMDGALYLFALEDSTKRTESAAVLTPDCTGSFVQQLRRITKLEQDYVKAKQDERSRIAARIRRAAQALGEHAQKERGQRGEDKSAR